MRCSICGQKVGIVGRTTDGRNIGSCGDAMRTRKGIISIQVNGDPYGSGYVGSESTDGERSWFYRGDIGARSRSWWRHYCRINNYTLRIE